MLHEITVYIVGYERAGGAENRHGVKSKNAALFVIVSLLHAISV